MYGERVGRVSDQPPPPLDPLLPTSIGVRTPGEDDEGGEGGRDRLRGGLT